MDHGAMLDQQAAPLDKSHVEEDSEVYLDDQEEAHHSPPAETKIYIPKEPDVLVVLAAPPGRHVDAISGTEQQGPFSVSC